MNTIGSLRPNRLEGLPQELDTFSRRLAFLVFLLVCVSMISYFPQMVELLTEGRLSKSPRMGDLTYFVFRIPRELLLATIVAYLGYGFIVSRRQLYLTRGAVQAIMLCALWVQCCVFYAVAFKDLPLIVPLLGLRIFQYIPLLLAGYVIARESPRLSLVKFAQLLRWYVAVIAVLGVFQTVTGAEKDTLFGSRSFGPFTNMNAFGATLVACSLFFLFARMSQERIGQSKSFGLWIVICAVMAFTTGSRTAITLTCVVATLSLYSRLSKRMKMAGLGVVGIMVVSFPLIFSAPAITGREVKRSNDKRWSLVEDVTASFESPGDLAFGAGLGLFSKSVVVLFGKDSFPHQVGNPHSIYLEIVGGFGIVGLAAYLFFFLVSMRKGCRPEMTFFLVIVGLIGLTVNLSGLFPVDALLLFLWGHLLGIGMSESAVPVSIERQVP